MCICLSKKFCLRSERLFKTPRDMFHSNLLYTPDKFFSAPDKYIQQMLRQRLRKRKTMPISSSWKEALSAGDRRRLVG